MSKHNCNKCKDKGYTEYHKLDGMTIYSWQKPLKRKCDCGQPSEILLK